MKSSNLTVLQNSWKHAGRGGGGGGGGGKDFFDGTYDEKYPWRWVV